MAAATRLTISSTLEEAAALAERVAGLFGVLPGLDADAVDGLRLCLAEALNNIVQHAYDGAPGRPIQAIVRATPEGCVVLLADEGRPMPRGRPPRSRPGPPDPDPADIASLPEGGFGWLLINAQIDRVAYRRQNGRNLLRMCKRLVSSAEKAPGSKPPRNRSRGDRTPGTGPVEPSAPDAPRLTPLSDA